MQDLMVKVSKIFQREKINFLLIGALARDMYFAMKKIPLNIRTKDVDLAVLVETWDEFGEIKTLLRNELGMSEVHKLPYRLMCGNIPIDLLPFGKIAEPGMTISWPGQTHYSKSLQLRRNRCKNCYP